MRASLIVFLWILLGIFFWWSKNNCCSDSSKMPDEKVGLAEDSSEQISLTDNVKQTLLTDLKFSKSSVVVDNSINTSKLLSEIKDAIGQDKGLVITGFAFSDEINPSELGLLRAKEVKYLLNLPETRVKIRSELVGEPYAEAVTFINYDTYKLDEGSSADNQNTATIIEEDKKTYVYMDNAVDGTIPVELSDQLVKLANRLEGNFCKITLVSYTDDAAIGNSWLRHAEDHLIRHGVIPNRISRVSRKLGDRERDMLELIINE